MRKLSFVAMLALVGCSGGDFSGQIESFQKNVAKAKMGSSDDYYLTKNGNDRVALVFGMSDDFAFCSELAALYMGRYPGDTYSCVPAQ